MNEFLAAYLGQRQSWDALYHEGTLEEYLEAVDRLDTAEQTLSALNASARIRKDARKVTPKMAALRSNPRLLVMAAR